MNARELIGSVEIEVVHKWRNSDLPTETQRLLEDIAEHYAVCEECCDAFDDMDYDHTTLHDFCELLDGTELSDWMC